MKKILIALCIAFASLNVNAQNYIAVSTTLYTNPGTFAAKASPAIEIGKQLGPLSVGIDVGKTNCSPVRGKDTTVYFELRPNLNVFQQGKFTNTLTIGVGAVPFSTQSMMGELSYGIEYAMSDIVHLNVNFGQYYFSGTNVSSSATYFGINIIRYFSTKKK
jgi:hypothetical protein